MVRNTSFGTASSPHHKSRAPLITSNDINHLTHAAAQVSLSPDLRAYIHDIIVFLRTHRAFALSPTSVSGTGGGSKDDDLPGPGVSAMATRHMHVLVRALAALHGLAYVTPSLASLAARKVYPHRVRIAAPETDRALMYGGEEKATREWLAELTVEEVIEEVLASVDAPL
jgi:MoxR-like ATPase